MTDIDNNILCLQAQLAEDEQDSQDSGSLHWNEDNSRELIKSFQSAYSIEIHSMRSFMGALNYGFPDLTQDRVGLRDEDPLNSLLPSGTGPVRVSGQPVSGLRHRPLDTEQRDQGEMEIQQQRGIKRNDLSQAPVPEKKSKTLSYKNDEEKENFTRLFVSDKMVFLDRSEISLKITGNLETLSDNAAQSKLIFRPFSENRITIPLKKCHPESPPVGKLEIINDSEALLHSMALVFKQKKKPILRY